MNAPPLELRSFRTHYRTPYQIAVCDVVLFRLLVIPGIKVCRKEETFGVELPNGLKWRDQRVSERFRRALLSLIGHEHPGFFQARIDPGPLLRRLSLPAENSSASQQARSPPPRQRVSSKNFIWE